MARKYGEATCKNCERVARARFDRPLHVFGDDYEWYVAYDIEDAMRCQREFTGIDWETQEDCREAWVEYDDNGDLLIWVDMDNWDIGEHGDGLLVIGQMKVWAEYNGRGFLCSTEY